MELVPLFQGLMPGNIYYARVRSINGSGTSGNSAVYTILTLPGVPAVNSALNITGNSFEASWESATGATSYKLDVSDQSSFVVMLDGYNNYSLTETSQYITGLQEGKTYLLSSKIC
ncbi:hypothetical protein [Fulvivirga ligni]|uniref:hypothetical protein n=1 Tax=Fulvivirga ligni TaxID=2904246 RepID=UPI001F3633E3|nr:hypothetical protein [Fulvivirga ligni]UII21605.1 hypothetical protein LVD16_27640 [Fulvivirga ligni]